jgi:hypothetical protein
VHSLRVRAEVRAQVLAGARLTDVARDMSVPMSTVFRWVTSWTPTDAAPPEECWRCSEESVDRAVARAYAYLLGQYLGDGHLVTSYREPVLRIYGCTDYREMLREIEQSIRLVRRSNPGRVSGSNSARLMTIQSCWKHWPCLFPQHGRGPKHARRIELAGWQREIVEAHPWPLIRGLIHSDGCRCVNRVTTRGKSYAYPRYFFSNESGDIIGILCAALDRVAVPWRLCRPNLVSIARRAAVAELDRHVGAKR